jgi:hypothetical protein
LLIEPFIPVYPQFGLAELLEVGNTVDQLLRVSNTQANFALARARAYQGVTKMRELTNIELDAVGGGWHDTVTKFINSFPINVNNTAQQFKGWAGFGNFNFTPQLNAVNSQI